jgi:hypothetical protein
MNTSMSVPSFLVLVFVLALVAGCKIEIMVPRGGDVVSLSQAYSCASGEICVVEVNDFYFSEDFKAEPWQGWVFMGWKRGWGHLCQNHRGVCHLSTVGFEANDILSSVVESDALFYLKPEFVRGTPIDQALAAIEDEARKTKATKDKEQRDKDFALATAAIGALSALNDAALATDLLNAAGDEEKKEKIRKASFERQKKLNIAMALINGAQAVLAGFAQGGLPMAIIAGVTAAAQLAAIVATTYQGGGGAAVTTPDNTAPSPDGAGDGSNGVQLSPVSNTSTILGNQQVFVTETDITNTQNNVSVIEESATF